jgi:hypothetical protein
VSMVDKTWRCQKGLVQWTKLMYDMEFLNLLLLLLSFLMISLYCILMLNLTANSRCMCIMFLLFMILHQV